LQTHAGCHTVVMAPPWDMVEALGTWFAGIATAGSLFLGFTILRSDRKKAEREQADAHRCHGLKPLRDLGKVRHHILNLPGHLAHQRQ
jgi:hypothetical protein